MFRFALIGQRVRHATAECRKVSANWDKKLEERQLSNWETLDGSLWAIVLEDRSLIRKNIAKFDQNRHNVKGIPNFGESSLLLKRFIIQTTSWCLTDWRCEDWGHSAWLMFDCPLVVLNNFKTVALIVFFFVDNLQFIFFMTPSGPLADFYLYRLQNLRPRLGTVNLLLS